MDFSVSLVHVTVCKCSLLTTGYFSLCFLKLILNFKKVPYRLLFSMIINHYQLQSLQLLYKVYKGKISVILVVNKIVLRYIIFVIIKFRNWPGNSPVGETFLLISLHVPYLACHIGASQVFAGSIQYSQLKIDTVYWNIKTFWLIL